MMDTDALPTSPTLEVATTKTMMPPGTPVKASAQVTHLNISPRRLFPKEINAQVSLASTSSVEVTPQQPTEGNDIGMALFVLLVSKSIRKDFRTIMHAAMSGVGLYFKNGNIYADKKHSILTNDAMATIDRFLIFCGLNITERTAFKSHITSEEIDLAQIKQAFKGKEIKYLNTPQAIHKAIADNSLSKGNLTDLATLMRNDIPLLKWKQPEEEQLHKLKDDDSSQALKLSKRIREAEDILTQARAVFNDATEDLFRTQATLFHPNAGAKVTMYSTGRGAQCNINISGEDTDTIAQFLRTAFPEHGDLVELIIKAIQANVANQFHIQPKGFTCLVNLLYMAKKKQFYMQKSHEFLLKAFEAATTTKDIESIISILMNMASRGTEMIAPQHPLGIPTQKRKRSAPIVSLQKRQKIEFSDTVLQNFLQGVSDDDEDVSDDDEVNIDIEDWSNTREITI